MGVNGTIIFGIYTLRLVERPSRVAAAHVRDPEQRLLAVGRDQHAVLGEDVAAAEAAAVREQRAVLAQQQPFVGPERPVKPQRVRRDGRGELRAVAALARARPSGAARCRSA